MLRVGLSLIFMFTAISFPNPSEAFFWSWFGDPVKPDSFKSQEHERLYGHYLVYKGLKDDGGWQKLEAKYGQTLEEQDEDFLALLANRLYLTQDLKKEELPEEKKLKLVVLMAGIKAFQKRHSLTPDGQLGEQTLAELNTSVDSRLEQIKKAMESWKDLPDELGKTYVMVNIPAFELGVYEKGKRAMSMKVIVGKEYKHETPIFSEKMTLIVLRPYWNVPRSIVEAEILPKALADEDYLESNRFELVKDFNDESEPIEINEESIELLEKGRINVRQKAGPGNSLGLVKFLFPNKYAVYLHDTPADQLFDRKERDLSHGCVRLEKPIELANYLIGKEDSAFTAERVSEIVKGDERYVYALKTPVPVHLVYQTVQVGQDDKLYFYNDIYDRL